MSQVRTIPVLFENKFPPLTNTEPAPARIGPPKRRRKGSSNSSSCSLFLLLASPTHTLSLQKQLAQERIAALLEDRRIREYEEAAHRAHMDQQVILLRTRCMSNGPMSFGFASSFQVRAPHLFCPAIQFHPPECWCCPSCKHSFSKGLRQGPSRRRSVKKRSKEEEALADFSTLMTLLSALRLDSNLQQVESKEGRLKNIEEQLRQTTKEYILGT